jgi:hypothetical protein
MGWRGVSPRRSLLGNFMADLIDLSCYKEYKGITSSTRDGKIQSQITRVSSLIEHYCNRNFTDYFTSPYKTEWHDAKTSVVTLDEFPVVSVIGVSTSIDGGMTQTALTENSASKDGYYVDLQNCMVLTQNGLNFLSSYDVAYRSLEITYQAGWELGELPGDLELAVLDLVHYYESEEKDPTKSLLGATIDNPQPYTANSFPPHIRRILDLYRYSA